MHTVHQGYGVDLTRSHATTNQAVAVDTAQLLSQNRFIGNLAAGTIALIAKVSGFLETILSAQPSQISQFCLGAVD